MTRMDKARQEPADDPLFDFFLVNDDSGESDLDILSTFTDSSTFHGHHLDAHLHEYLYFTLGGEGYGIELRRIKEIVKLPVVTPVPNSTDEVAGIISIRGTIVPLIELRKVLSLGQGDAENRRVLVVQDETGDVVGYLVDRVHHVVRISDEVIEPPPATMEGAGREYISGIGYSEGVMIILLDFDVILGGALQDA